MRTCRSGRCRPPRTPWPTGSRSSLRFVSCRRANAKSSCCATSETAARRMWRPCSASRLAACAHTCSGGSTRCADNSAPDSGRKELNLSSEALSRDELMMIADRVIRRGHQLRRRRTALQLCAVAAVVGIIAAMSLSFGTSEESLKTVDRPDVGQIVPASTTVPVAIGEPAVGSPAVDAVPVPGAPSLNLPPGVAPTTTAPSGRPSVSPLTGRIAFVRERDGSHAIYVMNADGSGEQRLTNSAVSDVSPAWSPDGTRIAFASYREGPTQIYVMNADGSAQQRLTFGTGDAGWPAW